MGNDKKSLWDKLTQTLNESRDAKIGAIGAQTIRDAYSDGDNKHADAYAKLLTDANSLGVALGTLGSVWASSPFLRVGLDTAGTVDGIRNVFSENGVQKTVRKYKEGDYRGAIKSGFGDVLDIAGIGDIAKIVSRVARPGYRALHAYDSILPFGYSRFGRKLKNYASDLITNPKVNIAKPKWKEGFHEPIFDRRQDAWAIYNGLPQTNGTYVKVDGTLDTYRYNDAVNADIKQVLSSQSVQRNFDAGGNHRGLSSDELIYKKDPESGIITADWHTTDTWDLNPFQKHGVEEGEITFSNRLKNRLMGIAGSGAWRDRAQKLRSKLFYKKDGSNRFNRYFKLDSVLNKYRTGDYDWQWKPDGFGSYSTGPADTFIKKIVHLKPIQKIDDKLSTLEVGRYIGAKPFNLDNTIHLDQNETLDFIKNQELKPNEVVKFYPSLNIGYGTPPR